jgi:hypothetical protein
MVTRAIASSALYAANKMPLRGVVQIRAVQTEATTGADVAITGAMVSSVIFADASSTVVAKPYAREQPP